MAASRSAASARRESGAAGTPAARSAAASSSSISRLERAPAGVQLEQNRLGRLARVPELPALPGRRRSPSRVDRELRRLEEPLLGDDRRSGVAPPTTTPRFPRPAARACSSSLRPVRGVGREHGRARQASAAATARSSPSPTSSDESTRRSPCSASARAAGGRPSSSSSVRSSAPSRSRPRRASSSSRSRSGGAHRRRVGPESLGERLGALAPELEPLGGALQPVERRGRLLAAPGGADELALDAVALAQQRLELLARSGCAQESPRRAAPRRSRGAPRPRPARAARSAP